MRCVSALDELGRVEICRVFARVEREFRTFSSNSIKSNRYNLVNILLTSCKILVKISSD